MRKVLLAIQAFLQRGYTVMRSFSIFFLLLLMASFPVFIRGEEAGWYNPQGGKKYHRIGICDTIDQQYWHAMQNIFISEAEDKGLKKCETCFAEDYLYERFIRFTQQADRIRLNEESVLAYASDYVMALSMMDEYTQTHPDYNYQFEAETFSNWTEEEIAAFGWWKCSLAPKDELQWDQVVLLGYAYLDQVCRVNKDKLMYYFSDPMYHILPDGSTRWRISMQVALNYGKVSLPHRSYDIYINTKNAELLDIEKH